MRHEKKLLVRPVLDCPTLEQLPDEDLCGWQRKGHYRIRSEYADYGDDRILGMTVYDKDGNAEARFWIGTSQHGAQVFYKQKQGQPTREPGKMYGAMVDSLYNIARGYGYHMAQFYGLPEDEDRIRSYLDAKKNESITEAISRVQSAEAKAKREKENERKRNKLRERFAGIEPPTDKFKQWIIDGPLAPYRYLWFSEAGKKETDAICSHCGKTVRIQRPYAENQWGSCPKCGSRAQYRSLKRLKRKYGESKREYVASFERHDGKILVRSYVAEIGFRGGLNYGGIRPKADWYIREEFRHWIDPKTGKTLETYKQDSRTNVVEVDGFVPGSEYNGYCKAWIWPGNLEDLRRETLNKYMPLETLAEHGMQVDPVELWRQAIICPAAEYLIKLGLFQLANSCLHKYGDREKKLFLKEKTPAGVLGVERDDIPQLIRTDPSIETLCIFRSLEKCGIRLNLEQLQLVELLKIKYSYVNTLHKMMKYLSPGKTLRYIRSQKMDGNTVLQEWDDYMSMAKSLKIDLQNPMLRFPRRLKVAHDEAAKVQEMRKNKAIDAAVGKTAAKLEDLRWEFDGLLIRPAHSQTELWEEGKALNHCVGRMGYADKMAKGQTAIFFIRKLAEPEKPYATLEINLTNWRIIQCYGKNDRPAGPQVEKMTKKWIHEIVKKKRKTADKEVTAA